MIPDSKLESRMNFIFGAGVKDDCLRHSAEEDQKREEAVSDDVLASLAEIQR